MRGTASSNQQFSTWAARHFHAKGVNFTQVRRTWIRIPEQNRYGKNHADIIYYPLLMKACRRHQKIRARAPAMEPFEVAIRLRSPPSLSPKPVKRRL
jgi:hypothetical protein